MNERQTTKEIGQGKHYNHLIYSTTKTEVHHSAIAALLFTCVSISILFLKIESINALTAQLHTNPLHYVFLLVPIINSVVIIKSYQKWQQWRYIGNASIYLSPLPVLIGQQLTGHINTPLARDQFDDAKIELCCYYRSRQGHQYHRKHRTGTKTLHWKASASCRIKAEIAGCSLHFSIPIPKHLPASSNKANQHYHWQVQVSYLINGNQKARHRFNIPVSLPPE